MKAFRFSPLPTLKAISPKNLPSDLHHSRQSIHRTSLRPLQLRPLSITIAPNLSRPSLNPPTRHRPSVARSSLYTMAPSTQEAHSALLIPGPIEFDDAVLNSMSHFSESHVGPAFIQVFGETLTLLRQLFQSKDPRAQSFVISGSGTLGWDIVASNLVEAGDDVLVLNTGYFSDGFADCLQVYGGRVTHLRAAIGDRPSLDQVEAALKERKYKVLTVTHVDTSTGVLSELRDLAAVVHRVSPETLLIVDGVCSAACEEIAFDEWGLDGIVTASQKAIGCPAGLSISLFSGRALDVFAKRSSPPTSYFASFANWLPIMKSYEARKPAYFATPSPQLVRALHTSLRQILAQPLTDRYAQHRAASDQIKRAVADLGLAQIPTSEANEAHGMTAIYLPNDIKPADILPLLGKRGVVFAGGIHKAIATKYIRLGHMGVSVTDASRTDIDKALQALRESLAELGYHGKVSPRAKL